jgi:hypothetical protein
MADRKPTAGRKESRATRRARDQRRGGEAEPAAKAPEGEKPEGEKVSSLLETTSKEVKQLLEAADDAAKQIRQAARGDDGEEGGDEASAVIADTNKEVRQVLESADDAAEKIREEAREEARQFVEDARRRAEELTTEQIDQVTKVSEQVLGELSALQGQLASLRQAYNESIRAMSAKLGVEETSEVWDAQRNGEPAPEEQSEMKRRLGRRQRRKEPAAEPEGISEGARLLALQQLMAGVDANVIESRLKKEFGIENPGAILEWMGMESKPERKPDKS